MYSSLSEFITTLEREGELLRVRAHVSTDCEIAEITERIAKSEGGGKALLFENTDGGFPVLTNMMGSPRRMALALGVERLEDLSQRIDSLIHQVVSPKNTLGDKLRMLPLLGEVAKWFPRTLKRRGACQQIVYEGERASLEMLPILRCRANDGGHFVTLPIVNTIDPETGVRNVGMYRMQVFDAHTTGMHWHRHKTGARHFDMYKARGERMPVTVAIGGDPVYAYCATAPMPDNMDEYLLAGFLRRKPVRLVKSLTNDIYIPEDCDFVIEGYVDPSEPMAVEGDFGDHTGFYSLTDLYPRFHVTAITHRRDAIFPATVVGIPPEEDAYISQATERIFLAPIRLALQPEIENMTMPVAGVSHNLAIVSIAQRYEGQAVKVAQSLWGAGQMMFNKYLVVVPASTSVRSREEIASLVRGVDMQHAIVRAEGIYDVLDHATATNGFGGKIALDLTNAKAVSPLAMGEVELLTTEGIDGVRSDAIEEWGIVLLFASYEAELNVKALAELYGSYGKIVAIFDSAAREMTHEELLWLATANTDPHRDVSLLGGVAVVDARPKHPNKAGNPARWPNVVTSDEATVSLVDRRWREYGMGETLVPSPSKRYRKLELSNKAEW